MPLCNEHSQQNAKDAYFAMVNRRNAVVLPSMAIMWLCLLIIIGCGITQLIEGQHVFQLTVIMLMALAIMITSAMYVCGKHIPLDVGDILHARKKAEKEEGIY